ncbi:diguanylate cyclase [Thermotoga caldifontis]|uniref:diguanylate cyclase n=1 Tax=Thermotoga caldifontis TaxID=1508419 RepID=UPI000596B091|nr:diguanylate cyclase [Thermotoga caldifontis]
MFKVLVADDDKLYRVILEDSLKKWGYNVITAEDGYEALQMLEQPDGPQLAVIDWVMPGLEGPEVCRRVRQQRKMGYIYIILLTGKDAKEDILKGFEAGADDYMVKPFDPEIMRYKLKIGERIIRMENELFQLATTDHLTGLLNRRSFMDRLEAELNRCIRLRRPLGLLIADIDFFKKINDTYGHRVGDEVLKNFAVILKKNLRAYDFAGRYGGEEFIVCLVECDIEESFKVAERLRTAIQSQPMFQTEDEREIFVTASFGVTALGQEPKNIDQLIKEADEALYEAKRSGRNRTVRANH